MNPSDRNISGSPEGLIPEQLIFRRGNPHTYYVVLEAQGRCVSLRVLGLESTAQVHYERVAVLNIHMQIPSFLLMFHIYCTCERTCIGCDIKLSNTIVLKCYEEQRSARKLHRKGSL